MYLFPSGAGRRSPGRVLVADDLEANVTALAAVLRLEGYEVIVAANGRDALDLVRSDKPDVVISDVRMPLIDGFDLCRALKADLATRLLPVVLVTGATEPQDRLRAIEAGANEFLTKPIDTTELRARVRSLLQFKFATDELDTAEEVLRSMALMIELRDAYTEGHCQRLARYGVELGAMLGLADEDLQALARGGYFHDLGKISLPDAILQKRGPLTEAEFTRVKEHPIVGDRLCGNLRVLQGVRSIVRHHHERLDGSGYPDGLAGDDVPLLAQIIGVVDVYDAMTTDRPYRDAHTPDQAMAELEREVERGWRRADIVQTFIAARRSSEAPRVARVSAG